MKRNKAEEKIDKRNKIFSHKPIKEWMQRLRYDLSMEEIAEKYLAEDISYSFKFSYNFKLKLAIFSLVTRYQEIALRHPEKKDEMENKISIINSFLDEYGTLQAGEIHFPSYYSINYSKSFFKEFQKDAKTIYQVYEKVFAKELEAPRAKMKAKEEEALSMKDVHKKNLKDLKSFSK